MRCLLENETNECVLARPAARIFLGRAPGGRQGALLSSAGVWQGCDGDGGGYGDGGGGRGDGRPLAG